MWAVRRENHIRPSRFFSRDALPHEKVWMVANDARTVGQEVSKEPCLTPHGSEAVDGHQVDRDTEVPDLLGHGITFPDLEDGHPAFEQGLVDELYDPPKSSFRPTRTKGIDDEQDPGPSWSRAASCRAGHRAWVCGSSAARCALAQRTSWRPRRYPTVPESEARLESTKYAAALANRPGRALCLPTQAAK
jgi:hypothetical protein